MMRRLARALLAGAILVLVSACESEPRRTPSAAPPATSTPGATMELPEARLSIVVPAGYRYGGKAGAPGSLVFNLVYENSDSSTKIGRQFYLISFAKGAARPAEYDASGGIDGVAANLLSKYSTIQYVGTTTERKPIGGLPAVELITHEGHTYFIQEAATLRPDGSLLWIDGRLLVKTIPEDAQRHAFEDLIASIHFDDP